ncbi:hypothetical protein [Xylanibacter ruminicola]|uniref:Uncharacterized protein n=1 Tax=Xylanibacter ruminicola TaxID=839 RepID=A0A1M6WVM7_XYLRU|nr:hypothetical protein [Xylanibacter ruminicola]SHK97694.1 hypothetical protein SAMN05216463_11820 [Xylanibacter ruminicola]
MYQADNTNYRTNESFIQEFTRSCLGRIIIATVIILAALLMAYFTAPKESDMDAEMNDNLMQCLEVNDGVKGDVVDDYVHNLTFIFTTADTTVIDRDKLETYEKHNRLESYRHTFYSTSYIYNNMHPEGTRVGVGIFGIIIPTVFYEDILLDVGPVHKGYEQKLNQAPIMDDTDLGETPNITEFHYKGDLEN